MNSKPSVVIALVVGLMLLFGPPANAQQHRATRLGHPNTRFAPPLVTPDDLRERFRDPKLRPDFAEILRQWRWTGNVEDMHRAAQTAPVTEIRIPVGSRMVFMSSRENGRPITLRDVLWAGDEPIQAFVFHFSSKGRRYRCVTPKPCSNFFLEDLGSESPELKLTLTTPAQSDLCAPIDVKITVRNTSGVPANNVRVTGDLPPGWKTEAGRTSLNLDAGALKPGTGMEFAVRLLSGTSGQVAPVMKATCAEGAVSETSVPIRVRAAALSVSCDAPGEVLLGRPVPICISVRNTGDAAAASSIVKLPIPAGATASDISDGGTSSDGIVSWQIHDLQTNEVKKLCAVFKRNQIGSLAFNVSAKGDCAQPTQSECATRIIGIPAILLDAVDLEDPVEVGKDVTYVVKITNQGTAVGTRIRIVCKLPDSQRFVSGSGVTTVHGDDRTVTVDPLPALEPKGVAEWRIVVKALKADDARFKLELTSDQFERPILEEESTHQY